MTEGTGTLVVDRVRIAAAMSEVFRYLSEAELLARWWPQAAESNPGPGGRLVLIWSPGNQMESSFDVFEPPTQLGYSFYDQRIDFQLREVGDRTEVQVTHACPCSPGTQIDGIVHVAQAWGALLVGLQVRIEHGIDVREGQE